MIVAFTAGAETGNRPSLADWLVGWGTLALAFITLVTLIATIAVTRADRADANRRLGDERKEADNRLRAERDYAEQVRLRERRVTAVAGLLDRIARIQPHLPSVLNVYRLGYIDPSLRRTMSDEQQSDIMKLGAEEKEQPLMRLLPCSTETEPKALCLEIPVVLISTVVWFILS